MAVRRCVVAGTEEESTRSSVSLRQSHANEESFLKRVKRTPNASMERFSRDGSFFFVREPRINLMFWGSRKDSVLGCMNKAFVHFLKTILSTETTTVLRFLESICSFHFCAKCHLLRMIILRQKQETRTNQQ